MTGFGEWGQSLAQEIQKSERPESRAVLKVISAVEIIDLSYSCANFGATPFPKLGHHGTDEVMRKAHKLVF
jgi:hypothetical protein